MVAWTQAPLSRWPAGLAVLLLLAACRYSDASLAPVQINPTAASGAFPAGAGEVVEFGLGPPFVVIRFGATPVDYEEPLAAAVEAALSERPDVQFHLLAVSAGGGPQVLRQPLLSNVEAVMLSLAEMGVPPRRVFLTAAASPSALIDEVRIYLR